MKKKKKSYFISRIENAVCVDENIGMVNEYQETASHVIEIKYVEECNAQKVITDFIKSYFIFLMFKYKWPVKVYRM